ncbi:MAG: DUF3078 domain-containing protein [Bacteroidales bacterium]|nr:DUF3078 domain-containing protein [Bacteroidales bacterium]
MKKLFLTLCVISLCAVTFAQNEPETPAQETKPWWLEGAANLSINFDYKLNADKMENFSTLALNTDLTLHHTKDRWRWDTQLIAQLKFKVDEDMKAYPWRKKNDHLELITRGAYNITERLFVTGSLRFTTIMAPLWHYSGSGESVTRNMASRFLAPAYLDLHPGIQWRPLDTKRSYLELEVAPIGGRLLICTLKDPVARAFSLGDYFAAKDGDAHFMFGGYVNFKYTWEVKKFTGRIQTALFFPYMKYGPYWDFDATLDIRLSYKFAKVFSINLMILSKYVNAAYRSTIITDKKIIVDAQAKDRIDFAEQLALGVGWTF